jgi:sugar phosphate isomerase/epimerase
MSTLTRRSFLKAAALGAATSGVAGPVPARAAASDRPRLGLDNFAVRAMGWKAPQLVDYAASLACDSLFITDLDAFESLEAADLRSLRERAAARGLAIQVGTWSICPTSKAFRPNRGTAEEHLALGLRVAHHVGSPVLRVVLGTWEDRLTDGGISRHIEETVRVCRGGRSLAQDLGVKIAVENHAGDMHSSELVGLIEAAGREFVGANLDSGNALWTLEDPIDSLERLGPYTLTTSLRDSAVWESEKGARVQWTAMGEGDMDLAAYFGRFREVCPGVPVHVETISGFSRELAYLEQAFWKAWPSLPASSLARFVSLAKRGRARDAFKAPAEADARRRAEQEYQRGEIERSLRYCRESLGMGRRLA